MAVIQLNPPGLASTDNGYISSITVYYNGQTNVLAPGGNGQITIPNASGGANAAARLVGGPGNIGGTGGRGLKLVSG